MTLSGRVTITLSEAKLYLRVDHEEDDLLISTLIDSAIEQAENEMNNDFTETDAETGVVINLAIPATVKLACLKMIATWYEHRDDQTASVRLGDRSVMVGEMPWDVRRMLAPYRKLPGL